MMQFEESDMYICEELIAEIGATYLRAYSGSIEKYFDNSMAYLKEWMLEIEKREHLLDYAFKKAKL